MTLVGFEGIELDVERSGSGPPLLLIMGMSGTALHWGEPFLGELRRDFEVIAFDHRGVGASTRLTGGRITIEQMASDASGLLAALEIERADVLGISMGGMIAQELALAHPEQVRTLGLGCTYCGGPGSALTTPEVMRKLGEAMTSGDRERALRVGFEVNVSPAFAARPAAWEDFHAIAMLRAVAVDVIVAQLHACTAHDTQSRLARLQMPTTVVHGTLDEMLPVQNGRLIASLIPGARLEILEGIGHMYCWEQPERAAEIVREQVAAVPA
ncbi:MAG: alpha/beta fold hydrolase [Solirubrobacteraceae bacterium]